MIVLVEPFRKPGGMSDVLTYQDYLSPDFAVDSTIYVFNLRDQMVKDVSLDGLNIVCVEVFK